MAGCARAGCVVLFVALGAAGCAAGSAGPRGPLAGEPGARFGFDLATATPDEVYWGDSGILPRRVEMRVAPVGWADIGGDIGWLDAGADLRFGLPSAPERFFAFNLALGARSGVFGAIKDTKLTTSYFARLEAYPLLHTSYRANGAVRTMGRAVSAIGIDGGDFYHGPSYTRSPSQLDHGFGPPESHHIDRELRLEASVGYHLVSHRRLDPSFQITLQPYTVLVRETNNQHKWGMIFVLTGALFLPFERGASR